MKKKTKIVIAAAVILAAAAAALLIVLSGGGERYPVKLRQNGSSLCVTIKGNKDAEKKWITGGNYDGVVMVEELSNTKKAEFRISPDGAAPDFFNVVFSLPSGAENSEADYTVSIKGFVNEDGIVSDYTCRTFDCGSVSESDESGFTATAASDMADGLNITLTSSGQNLPCWDTEDNEGLSFGLSAFNSDCTAYNVTADAAGTYTAVFTNETALKTVQVKFSLSKDGVYRADNIKIISEAAPATDGETTTEG